MKLYIEERKSPSSSIRSNLGNQTGLTDEICRNRERRNKRRLDGFIRPVTETSAVLGMLVGMMPRKGERMLTLRFQFAESDSKSKVAWPGARALLGFLGLEGGV
jgi:hypothetical protein